MQRLLYNILTSMREQVPQRSFESFTLSAESAREIFSRAPAIGFDLDDVLVRRRESALLAKLLTVYALKSGMHPSLSVEEYTKILERVNDVDIGEGVTEEVLIAQTRGALPEFDSVPEEVITASWDFCVAHFDKRRREEAISKLAEVLKISVEEFWEFYRDFSRIYETDKNLSLALQPAEGAVDLIEAIIKVGKLPFIVTNSEIGRARRRLQAAFGQEFAKNFGFIISCSTLNTKARRDKDYRKPASAALEMAIGVLKRKKRPQVPLVGGVVIPYIGNGFHDLEAAYNAVYELPEGGQVKMLPIFVGEEGVLAQAVQEGRLDLQICSSTFVISSLRELVPFLNNG